ncbi:MAG: hypothetical protein AAGA10_09880 [Bacteroidota bacterium]
MLEKAHDLRIEHGEFLATHKEYFSVKVFTVEEAVAHKTHHWFIQVLDSAGYPLNFASLTLDGYLQANPAIAFNYIGNVISLCSDGKYLIGFVKVSKPGIYRLEFHIDHFGKKDTIQCQIEIATPLLKDARNGDAEYR